MNSAHSPVERAPGRLPTPDRCATCGKPVDRRDREILDETTDPDGWTTVLAIAYTAQPCGCVTVWRRRAT